MDGQQRSTAPKGQDLPGWNDPPKFMNVGTPPVMGPTKTKLNKRIAFPLQNSPGIQSESTNRLIPNQPPPLMPTTQILKPPTITDNDLDTNPSNTASCQRDSTMKFLENYLSTLNDEAKTDDISKKLDIMNTVWSENKLSCKTTDKLLHIIEAIKIKSFTNALEMYKELKESQEDCSDWIEAIGKIISILKDDYDSNIYKSNTTKCKIGPVIHI